MTPHRAYADTPLGQLHYTDAGTGPTVLMLHQAPRSLDEFAEVQAELSANCRTIAMDLPGFGMSFPLPAPQTIEAMAGGVTALLDALELDSAVLLGHHTGAAVALEVAASAPQRTDAVVLSSMPWVGPERRARKGSLGVDDAEQQADGAHLTQLWSLRQPYYPGGRPDLLDRFIRDALAPGVDPAEGHRACDRYLMDERIGFVHCPVMVMTASADPFATPAAPHILNGLTNAERVVQVTLEGGMIPAMEQCSSQVAAHVRDFVGSLESGNRP